ncbi:MAG: aromatic hydrocarbon degradation protein [Citrobacter freundii]|nr:MAG: aromatic hydrocarbon degradation protein [Citrobacter freundii]
MDTRITDTRITRIKRTRITRKGLSRLGFIACFSLTANALFAQIPEDVLKYSWQPVNGTARINAVGGAMGSLGGDISATFTNPAGLAFYKTGDLVISPGYNFLNNKSTFRGTPGKDKDNTFNLGASGYVAGWGSDRGKWKSQAFGIAVTRTANFNNTVYYTGQNDFSSGAEQYAAEAASSGVSLEDMPYSNRVSFGTRMAAWNYLIDSASLPGHTGQDVISMSMWDALKNGGNFLVNQSQLIETSGGITEIALGYAGNKNDKFYLGGSLGIPILNYQKNTRFREEDATNNSDNNFGFYELNETFKTKGVGFNLKLGAIMKPAEFIRVGLAVHSPTWYALEDSYFGRMSVNLDKYRTVPGTTTVTSDQLVQNGAFPNYKYQLMTPWRFMVSGSYVLREAEDVRQQKGFITADVEYVTYKSNKYASAEEYNDDTYYDGLNSVIKQYYKNAFNFRVGGELKFTTIMTRLGFSYYGNPYADPELKANKMFVSGGLGYRNNGIFIDLTYTHAIQKDVDFPYRLPDKANTFANLKGTGSNIMLTFGIKI